MVEAVNELLNVRSSYLSSLSLSEQLRYNGKICALVSVFTQVSKVALHRFSGLAYSLRSVIHLHYWHGLEVSQGVERGAGTGTILAKKSPFT